ncbi:hypothetical protein HOE04_05090 [archaeon]|jgi:hypothetical protein|nr:hypothetical protein [archaeon]
MTDIFSNKILCGKCNIRMTGFKINKNGFVLRAVACSKCNDKIIHPRDEMEYNDFMNLRKKEFNVKMRFVGNSYAVSIPREIVEFMKEQEDIMDDMVKLCFEEFGKISLVFGRCDGSRPHATSKLRVVRGDL